jgi:hypothetical protein
MLVGHGRWRAYGMTELLLPPVGEREAALTDLLSGIVVRFGASIEFWTLVCLARHELGDPTAFIDRQWIDLRDQVQKTRESLQEGENSPSQAVLEQVAKLLKITAELRETFDFFINANRVAEKELEAAIMKLAHIWQDVRMRVWLLGALILLPQPPALPTEKEADCQTTLDSLFDQFLAARTLTNGAAHQRNGKSG